MLFKCSVSCSSFLFLPYVFFCRNVRVFSRRMLVLFMSCVVPIFKVLKAQFVGSFDVFVRLRGSVFWYV